MQKINNNHQSNIFITIEGIDGTGKSTITRMLSELIGATCISTPSHLLKKQRDLIEKFGSRSQKFDFYTAAIIQQQEEIINLLKTSSIICDRYIHSTFAYQWPIDIHPPENISEFFEKIKIPDYSFLLIADEKVRINRIRNRELITGIINESDHRDAAIDIAQRRFMAMHELIKVETSTKTPEEICDSIASLISSKKSKYSV